MEIFLSNFAESILMIMLVVLCFSIIFSRDLIISVSLLSVFSLLVAGLFVFMNAPDVAITEAAIGAAISTIFYLAGIFIVGKEVKLQPTKPIITCVLCILFVILAAYAIQDIALIGDINSPANSHVANYYINDSYQEMGVKNIVTSILASYRGFDTLGEVFVIFTAGAAVTLILGSNSSAKKPAENTKDGLNL